MRTTKIPKDPNRLKRRSTDKFSQAVKLAKEIIRHADAPSLSQAKARITPLIKDLIGLKLGAQDAWRIGKIISMASDENVLLARTLYRVMDERLALEARRNNNARYENFVRGIRRDRRKVLRIISPRSLGGFLRK